ncbi:MAG: molybdopterin-dependent oxidoreductase, partial [Sediminibacterium sp.]|nr:molybdopterin-dependent oxidoreductase [Sediminibacterium sp.]
QKTIELKKTDKERGNLKDWENPQISIDAYYTIQAEVHHPMEPHATIAEWVSGDKVKLYDKNQGVNNVQRVISNLFEIKVENVEVISEYVGGGFGAGLLVWPHTIAAVMASKQINRPIKIVLTRQQMFSCVGFRPASWQKIKLGSDNTGKFIGLLHQHKNECSKLQNFSDGMGRISKICYAIPNLKIENAEVPLNIPMPTWMRGPGECSGAFALESAIDELSYKLNIDPIDLRLKNISYNNHPDNNLPWSTHFVKECIEIGAEKINWKNRKSQPKKNIQNNGYIGYGMAVGMWGAGRTTASASISINKNGEIIVKSAITDIGTGTGTGMQNVANLITGMPKSNIKIQLGNSNLPPAPSQGGSIGLSSIVGAVEAASTNLMNKILSVALILNPTFKELKASDVYLTKEGIVSKNKCTYWQNKN